MERTDPIQTALPSRITIYRGGKVWRMSLDVMRSTHESAYLVSLQSGCHSIITWEQLGAIACDGPWSSPDALETSGLVLS